MVYGELVNRDAENPYKSRVSELQITKCEKYKSQ